jgi:hypothetical protein
MGPNAPILDHIWGHLLAFLKTSNRITTNFFDFWFTYCFFRSASTRKSAKIGARSGPKMHRTFGSQMRPIWAPNGSHVGRPKCGPFWAAKWAPFWAQIGNLDPKMELIWAHISVVLSKRCETSSMEGIVYFCPKNKRIGHNSTPMRRFFCELKWSGKLSRRSFHL